MGVARRQLAALAGELAVVHRVPVELVEIEQLRRERVVRVRVEAPGAALPATMIVKAVPDDDRTDTSERQLHNEVAALLFIGTASRSVGPRLLAADLAAGAIALEDLGSASSLSDVLVGSDPVAAHDALVSFARLLGQVHADSVGRSEEYYRLRETLGPADRDLDRFFIRRRDVRTCLEDVVSQATRHGLPAPGSTARRDFDEVLDTLRRPGDCLAFTTGDPCPDNVMVRRDGQLLIDFEVAAFRHALLDAAYLVLPFPNCWCWRPLPPPIATDMLSAYRAEITAVLGSLADDAAFEEALGHCCAAWLVFHLAVRLPFVVDSDRTLDLFGERERLIVMLRNFLAMPGPTRAAPHLRGWLSSLLENFERRWPKDVHPTRSFPALKHRTQP